MNGKNNELCLPFFVANQETLAALVQFFGTSFSSSENSMPTNLPSQKSEASALYAFPPAGVSTLNSYSVIVFTMFFFSFFFSFILLSNMRSSCTKYVLAKVMQNNDKNIIIKGIITGSVTDTD